MDRPSNPFALRTTENIDSDELFLKLFSTEPMRKLQKQNDEGKLWHFVTFIQSPPGFGKTSLLRIFYPTVLKKIVSHNKETRDVFEALNKLNVKDKNRIKRLARQDPGKQPGRSAGISAVQYFLRSSKAMKSFSEDTDRVPVRIDPDPHASETGDRRQTVFSREEM